MARPHVQAVGIGWHPDVRDVAVLLTSELVANAVVHTTGPVTLSVQDGIGQVRVEVVDGDSRPLRQPGDPGSETAESGRGLQIVDALASAWGSDHRPDAAGKTTWFELPHPPASSS